MSLNLLDDNGNTRFTQKELREYKKQRIERGFAECDWWAIDGYLLQLIPDLLEQLKDKSSGVPWTRELGDMPFEEALDKRNSLLKRMITHFRLAYAFSEMKFEGDILSHLIDQAEADEELKEDILGALPKQAYALYRSGGKDALASDPTLCQYISDAEMRKGFDMLKEHFWQLYY